MTLRYWQQPGGINVIKYTGYILFVVSSFGDIAL